MKDNPITVGFDDAAFELKSNIKTTRLIGVICQGTRLVDVVSKEIQIDGNDATQKLIELVKLIENHVQYILTDTITFGGFNVINIQKIYEETEKPLIAITDREVNLESVKNALIKRFPSSYPKKLRYIINAGNLYQTDIPTAGGISKVYFHVVGIEIEEAELLIKKLCIDSKIPEPVRMAHLIGKMFLY